jgi:hypothetical protein
MASIADKVDLAREKVILDKYIMTDVYLSIKDIYADCEDKSLIRELNLAGCELLTVLGRTDKVKRGIVQEHGSFSSEISKLFTSSDQDFNLQVAALKTIANFSVDFKSFLTCEGVLDKLVSIVCQPAVDVKLGSIDFVENVLTLKKCAIFTLKNLSFGCSKENQTRFDEKITMKVLLDILD